MQDAPLFNDLAEGPEGGKAFWFRADDGVRLRAGFWPAQGKGTIILLPGRTEYVEKYGRAARDITALGYPVLVIDWRGQGMADRLTDDPMVGHVGRFIDYQRDLMAALDLARKLGLPEPYYMVAHSMGGCIGLRALHAGLPFKAASFSAPMWGISMAPGLRPFAWTGAMIGTMIGKGGKRSPQTSADAYVLTDPFEGNTLTSEEDMWEYMKWQASGIDGAALGGPSLSWLYEALNETRALQKLGHTRHKVRTFLGTDEQIVSTKPIHHIMGGWTHGELIMVPGAQHEVMMEKPHIRRDFFDKTDELFTNS